MTPDTIDGYRVRAYTALALAFDRPTDEFVEALSTGAFTAELRTAGSGLGVDELTEAADAIAGVAPRRQALMDAYTEIFGPGQDDGPSLYEVAYAPGSLVTNTDVLADIAGFYRAFGLGPTDDRRDRVDALATELEFIGFLALRREQYTDDDADGHTVATEATVRFLEEHLGRWVPRLADDVAATVAHPVYGPLTDALAALVADDIERFDIEARIYAQTPVSPLEAMAGLDPTDGRTELECGSTPPVTPASHLRDP